VIDPCLQRFERNDLAILDWRSGRFAMAAYRLDQEGAQDRVIDFYLSQDGGQVGLRGAARASLGPHELEIAATAAAVAIDAGVHEDRLHAGGEESEGVRADVAARRHE